MQKFGGFLVLLTVAATVSYSIIAWTGFFKTPQPPAKVVSLHHDQRDVENLLKHGQIPSAYTFIKNKLQSPNLQDPGIWKSLFVKTAADMRDLPQLRLIYEHDPLLLQENEKASLLLANTFLNEGRMDDYTAVRQPWSASGNQRWVILDSDALVLNGKVRKAIRLLNAQTLDGQEEADRLIRLALLHSNEHPKLTWEYLTKAQKSDLKPDSVLFRAMLLEGAGMKELAYTDLKNSAMQHPQNGEVQDQYVAFLLRHGLQRQALNYVASHLGAPSTESLWIKGLFLQQTTAPISYSWTSTSMPTGAHKAYTEYLLRLKPGQFWDIEREREIAHFVESDQSAYWLRVLNYLKLGKEKAALELLTRGTQETWYPNLENELKEILTYRLTGNTTATDKETLALWHSKEAFIQPLLKAGFDEAALQLNPSPILPDSLPTSLTTDLTQVIDRNRGVFEALTFASKQKTTPELTFLMAELFLKSGNTDAAVDQLKKLNTPESIQLQESIALKAVEEGNIGVADRVFEHLENQSPYAKAYLAEKAFKDSNWDRARSLTVDLLRQYPDDEVLQQNLRTIDNRPRLQ